MGDSKKSAVSTKLFVGILFLALCVCFTAGCVGDAVGDDGPPLPQPNDVQVTKFPDVSNQSDYLHLSRQDGDGNLVCDTVFSGDDIYTGYNQKYARREAGKGVEITLDSVGEIHNVLQNTTYGLVSAGANPSLPGEKDMPPEFFKGRHEQFRKELIGMGYCFTGVLGNYDGFEDSFLVMTNDSGREDMIRLGHMFNQESVIHVDHGNQEIIYTCDAITDMGEITLEGTTVPGEGYEEVGKEETNYYTEITLLDGSTFRFRLFFDWDSPVPPSEAFSPVWVYGTDHPFSSGFTQVIAISHLFP